MNQEYIVRRILREVASICEATGAFRLDLTVDTYNPSHVNLVHVLKSNQVLVNDAAVYMNLPISMRLPVPFSRELIFYYEENTPQKIFIRSDVSLVALKLDSKIQKYIGVV